MTMITLQLNPQDESLLLQAVKIMGVSIEQFILQSMRKEAMQAAKTQEIETQEKSMADLIAQFPKPTSFQADDAVELQRAWRDEW